MTWEILHGRESGADLNHQNPSANQKRFEEWRSSAICPGVGWLKVSMGCFLVRARFPFGRAVNRRARNHGSVGKTRQISRHRVHSFASRRWVTFRGICWMWFGNAQCPLSAKSRIPMNSSLILVVKSSDPPSSRSVLLRNFGNRLPAGRVLSDQSRVSPVLTNRNLELDHFAPKIP